MCACVEASLISIQQPISWHTAVTVPVVTNDLPLYAFGSLTTVASAIAGVLAEIGSPSFVAEAAAGAGLSGVAFVQAPTSMDRITTEAMRMLDLSNCLAECQSENRAVRFVIAACTASI